MIKPASDKQIKALYVIARVNNVTEERVNEVCQELFGCQPAGLGRDQASVLIDLIKFANEVHAA